MPALCLITAQPVIVKCSWSALCCLLRCISGPKYIHTYWWHQDEQPLKPHPWKTLLKICQMQYWDEAVCLESIVLIFTEHPCSEDIIIIIIITQNLYRAQVQTSSSQRRSDSIITHTHTIAGNTDQTFGCDNLGGLDFWILMNTLIGCISWFGGLISANSINVIPANTPYRIGRHSKKRQQKRDHACAA